jgi:hypothetical protein
MACFATGCQPDGGNLLAVSDCHPGPRFHKERETFCKDFPLTEEVATIECPNGKKKLDAAAQTEPLAP